MKKINYIIKYELLHRFDPYHDFLKQAIRTALSSLIAVLIYRAFPQYQQAYWAILTGAFIIQTRIGPRAGSQIFSVLICGTLSSIAAYIAIVASNNVFLLALYLGLLGGAIILYGARGLNSLIRAFFIGLFAIMSGGLASPDPAWHRSIFILIGTIIALLCSCLWLYNPSEQNKRVFKIYLHSIVEFIYRQIILVLYENNSDKIEARLHERRNRLLRQLRQLRNLNHPKLAIAENLWNLSIGFGNLRYLFPNNKKEIFNYTRQKLISLFSSYINQKYLITDVNMSILSPEYAAYIDYYVDHLINLLKEGSNYD